jgi:hypothetical protein
MTRNVAKTMYRAAGRLILAIYPAKIGVGPGKTTISYPEFAAAFPFLPFYKCPMSNEAKDCPGPKIGPVEYHLCASSDFRHF